MSLESGRLFPELLYLVKGTKLLCLSSCHLNAYMIEFMSRVVVEVWVSELNELANLPDGS